MVLNPRNSKKERVQKIFRLHSNRRVEIEEAQAGDIVAFAGLKESRTGDTLCESKGVICYESLDFPEPVIYVAIEPKTSKDSAKLLSSLDKLKIEDPSFDVKEDTETGQMLIGGMGELHLDIMVDRLKREFAVSANVGAPQVAYREGLLENSKATESFVKPGASGGSLAVSATVELIVGELEDSAGVLVKVQGLDAETLRRVIQGSKEALLSGPIAGYPVMGIYPVVHEITSDSDQVDPVMFQIACNKAVRKALYQSKSTLLEPQMVLEIHVPEDYLSAVVNDLNSRKAKIQSMDQKNEYQLVYANVPLSEMFGYTTVLRSLTQGRGSYTMKFDSYVEVPREVLARFKGQ
jgi:elongation factor G